MKHQLSLSPKPAVLRFNRTREGSQKHANNAGKDDPEGAVEKETERTKVLCKSRPRHVKGNVIKCDTRKYPRNRFVDVSKNVTVEIEGLT